MSAIREIEATIMHTHKKRHEEEKSGQKPGLKSEEPLAEGPVKKMDRRRALQLLGTAGLAGLAAKAFSSISCVWKPYGLEGVPKEDGGVDGGIDAEVKDVEVSPDVKQPDARVDSSVHDSGIDSGVDSSVQDSGADSSVVDAETPDSGVDSGVDSGADGSATTCNGVFNESGYGLITGTQELAVGGYSLRYASYIDSNNITIDVECASDQSVVLSGEQFTKSVQRTVSLGDKNLQLTVTWLNSTSAMVNAETLDP